MTEKRRVTFLLIATLLFAGLCVSFGINTRTVFARDAADEQCPAPDNSQDYSCTWPGTVNNKKCLVSKPCQETQPDCGTVNGGCVSQGVCKGKTACGQAVEQPKIVPSETPAGATPAATQSSTPAATPATPAPDTGGVTTDTSNSGGGGGSPPSLPSPPPSSDANNPPCSGPYCNGGGPGPSDATRSVQSPALTNLTNTDWTAVNQQATVPDNGLKLNPGVTQDIQTTSAGGASNGFTTNNSPTDYGPADSAGKWFNQSGGTAPAGSSGGGVSNGFTTNNSPADYGSPVSPAGGSTGGVSTGFTTNNSPTDYGPADSAGKFFNQSGGTGGAQSQSALDTVKAGFNDVVDGTISAAQKIGEGFVKIGSTISAGFNDLVDAVAGPSNAAPSTAAPSDAPQSGSLADEQAAMRQVDAQNALADQLVAARQSDVSHAMDNLVSDQGKLLASTGDGNGNGAASPPAQYGNSSYGPAPTAVPASQIPDLKAQVAVDTTKYMDASARLDQTVADANTLKDTGVASQALTKDFNTINAGEGSLAKSLDAEANAAASAAQQKWDAATQAWSQGGIAGDVSAAKNGIEAGLALADSKIAADASAAGKFLDLPGMNGTPGQELQLVGAPNTALENNAGAVLRTGLNALPFVTAGAGLLSDGVGAFGSAGAATDVASAALDSRIAAASDWTAAPAGTNASAGDLAAAGTEARTATAGAGDAGTVASEVKSGTPAPETTAPAETPPPTQIDPSKTPLGNPNVSSGNGAVTEPANTPSGAPAAGETPAGTNPATEPNPAARTAGLDAVEKALAQNPPAPGVSTLGSAGERILPEVLNGQNLNLSSGLGVKATGVAVGTGYLGLFELASAPNAPTPSSPSPSNSNYSPLLLGEYQYTSTNNPFPTPQIYEPGSGLVGNVPPQSDYNPFANNPLYTDAQPVVYEPSGSNETPSTQIPYEPGSGLVGNVPPQSDYNPFANNPLYTNAQPVVYEQSGYNVDTSNQSPTQTVSGNSGTQGVPSSNAPDNVSGGSNTADAGSNTSASGSAGSGNQSPTQTVSGNSGTQGVPSSSGSDSASGGSNTSAPGSDNQSPTQTVSGNSGTQGAPSASEPAPTRTLMGDSGTQGALPGSGANSTSGGQGQDSPYSGLCPWVSGCDYETENGKGYLYERAYFDPNDPNPQLFIGHDPIRVANGADLTSYSAPDAQAPNANGSAANTNINSPNTYGTLSDVNLTNAGSNAAQDQLRNSLNVFATNPSSPTGVAGGNTTDVTANTAEDQLHNGVSNPPATAQPPAPAQPTAPASGETATPAPAAPAQPPVAADAPKSDTAPPPASQPDLVHAPKPYDASTNSNSGGSSIAGMAAQGLYNAGVAVGNIPQTLKDIGAAIPNLVSQLPTPASIVQAQLQQLLGGTPPQTTVQTDTPIPAPPAAPAAPAVPDTSASPPATASGVQLPKAPATTVVNGHSTIDENVANQFFDQIYNKSPELPAITQVRGQGTPLTPAQLQKFAENLSASLQQSIGTKVKVVGNTQATPLGAQLDPVTAPVNNAPEDPSNFRGNSDQPKQYAAFDPKTNTVYVRSGALSAPNVALNDLEGAIGTAYVAKVYNGATVPNVPVHGFDTPQPVQEVLPASIGVGRSVSPDLQKQVDAIKNGTVAVASTQPPAPSKPAAPANPPKTAAKPAAATPPKGATSAPPAKAPTPSKPLTGLANNVKAAFSQLQAAADFGSKEENQKSLDPLNNTLALVGGFEQGVKQVMDNPSISSDQKAELTKEVKDLNKKVQAIQSVIDQYNASHFADGTAAAAIQKMKTEFPVTVPAAMKAATDLEKTALATALNPGGSTSAPAPDTPASAETAGSGAKTPSKPFAPVKGLPNANPASGQAIADAVNTACKAVGCNPQVIQQAMGGVCAIESNCNSAVKNGINTHKGLYQVGPVETQAAINQIQKLAQSPNLSDAEKAAAQAAANAAQAAVNTGNPDKNPNYDPVLGAWLGVGYQLSNGTLPKVSAATADPKLAAAYLEIAQMGPATFNGNFGPNTQMPFGAVTNLRNNGYWVNYGDTAAQAAQAVAAHAGSLIPSGIAFAGQFTPGGTPASAPATPNFAVGDSIAHGLTLFGGLAGSENVKDGSSPEYVYNNLLKGVPQGANVILSSGASNDPSQIAKYLPMQLDALKAAGAATIQVAGVGTAPQVAGANDALKQAIDAYNAKYAADHPNSPNSGVTFNGPLDPNNLAADGVHPKDYNQFLSSFNGAPGVDASAPVAPAGGWKGSPTNPSIQPGNPGYDNGINRVASAPSSGMSYCDAQTGACGVPNGAGMSQDKFMQAAREDVAMERLAQAGQLPAGAHFETFNTRANADGSYDILDKEGNSIAHGAALKAGPSNSDGTIRLLVGADGKPLGLDGKTLTAGGVPLLVSSEATLPKGTIDSNGVLTFTDNRPVQPKVNTNPAPAPAPGPGTTTVTPPPGYYPPYANPGQGYPSMPGFGGGAGGGGTYVPTSLPQSNLTPLGTPQLYCSPQTVVASSTQPISLNWSCLYGTPVATGFSTGGASIGQVSVPVPANASGIFSFSLSCASGNQISAPAICPITIQSASTTATSTVGQSGGPAVQIIANPSAVASGATAELSWTSVNVSSCAVAAPDGTMISSNATSGTATTVPLSSTSVFTATCMGTSTSISASTTVTVQ